MFKKIYSYKFIFLILFSIFFTACFNFGTIGKSDDSDDVGSTPGQQVIISVTMGAIQAAAGGNPQILGQSEVYPSYTFNLGAGFIYNSEQGLIPLSSGYTWTSSDENIAKVSSDGRVTALSTGDVTITATDSEENSYDKTISVVSQETANLLKSLAIDQINGAYKIKKGDTNTILSATGTYTDNTTDNKGVYWISSNETVMTVGLVSGQVNGIKDGTATIVAIKDMVMDSKTFTVATDIESLDITNGASASIDYPNTLTLNTTILDCFSNTITPTITWQTSDSNVLTVSNGLISTVHGGTARVTASVVDPWSGNPISDYIDITVNKLVSSVKVNGASDIVNKGSTLSLSATVTYNDGTSDSDVEWTSNNEGIATVTNGTVTGVAAGTTTITASKNGVDSSTYTINVRALTDINISGTNTIDVDDTSQLTASGTYNFNPLTADITNNVTWESNNTGVATVNTNTGLVKGIAAGTTTIRAMKDGIYKDYSITVLSPYTITIYVKKGITNLNGVHIWNVTDYNSAETLSFAAMSSVDSSKAKIYESTHYYKIVVFKSNSTDTQGFNFMTDKSTKIYINGSNASNQDFKLNDSSTKWEDGRHEANYAIIDSTSSTVTSETEAEVIPSGEDFSTSIN